MPLKSAAPEPRSYRFAASAIELVVGDAAPLVTVAELALQADGPPRVAEPTASARRNCRRFINQLSPTEACSRMACRYLYAVYARVAKDAREGRGICDSVSPKLQ